MTEPLRNLVTLSASVELEVEQDFIAITFQHVEVGENPRDVQDKLNVALSGALEVARPKKKGKSVQIQTGGVRVTPAYNDEGDMKGYSGSASLIVSGTDTQTISGLTADIVTMTVADVSMSVSPTKRRKYEDGLAKDAIAAFREKANQYAQAFGAKGASLINTNVRVHGGHRGGGRVVAASAMAYSAKMESPSVDVEFGKETLTASVDGTIQLAVAGQ